MPWLKVFGNRKDEVTESGDEWGVIAKRGAAGTQHRVVSRHLGSAVEQGIRNPFRPLFASPAPTLKKPPQPAPFLHLAIVSVSVTSLQADLDPSWTLFGHQADTKIFRPGGFQLLPRSFSRCAGSLDPHPFVFPSRK